MRLTRSLFVLVIVVAGALLWHRQAPSPGHVAQTAPAASASEAGAAASLQNLPAYLPPEARDTLALIVRGGPFAHAQDGSVFGNREGLLPAMPRGYYHEYTVETPGLGYRGARRLIAGGNPPVVYYYTDDHYRSFRRFELRR
ncbi:ribonuclease domain-containing protein [Frateuria defendens]|uniref:ribonuclease domain-containing protein n=1 Tax=Frateuria defendens TaxID=2219559 RepID=UPI00066FC59B|nr:ribonuclease domain-containing protein [Frateuria defendens]